ncbi:glycosyl hydrolase family 95 catalytic domain-containing protein [Luteimicrobium sp. DT211]|uniref:glycosyl hydrolase family 95 catalytic domain-containing protein n=1 Tax=Luteimicrobium sp. DT211 TaxID=3393412 RepID=UPI003CF09EAE
MRAGGRPAVRLRAVGPARQWVEAFPIGNGRVGAMVFGGRTGARLQVNDATAWSGGPAGPRDALAALLADGAGPAVLADLRDAVRAGDDARATALAQRLQGPHAQAFQPLVDVVADVGPARGSLGVGVRELDLRDGVVTETWAAGVAAVDVVQAWYADAGDGCLHGRWRAAEPLDVTLAVTSPHPAEPGPTGRDGVGVLLTLPHDVGPAVVREGAPGGAIVAAAVVAASSDGTVRTDDGRLTVRGATWLEVVVATATTSRWPEPGPLRDPGSASDDAWGRARAALPADAAAGDRALGRHTAAHRALVDRTTLSLTGPDDLVLDLPGALESEPLSARAQAAFAFGRYALLACSRPGSPPATLQGIWNEQVQPPWSSAYTLNINVQMAYWAADAVGLPECVGPLVDLVRVLAREGEGVARELYGCRGWVAHHNSDVWGWALPVGGGTGDPSWAAWWTAGPWLCTHLWSHWLVTGDRDFLRDVWPLLRDCARFCVDWLVETPDGGLVPSPSSSPENVFRRATGSASSTGAVCAGSTMDVALVRALLESCVAATTELGDDAALGLDAGEVGEWTRALSRLPLPAVTTEGLLAEWPGDVEAVDPHHRHLSHLVGLYPLDQLDVDDTPDLAVAASRSLDARGPGSTGWSLAWKTALRARLGQGRAVEELLGQALGPARDDAGPWAGGLLPNLFSTHPPFQLDGNLGLVAGLTEALVSSTGARLQVLPALPPGWRDGSITGVRTHGGVVVDVRWAGGALAELVLRPARDTTRRVVHGGAERELTLLEGRPVRLGRDLAEL